MANSYRDIQGGLQKELIRAPSRIHDDYIPYIECNKEVC